MIQLPSFLSIFEIHCSEMTITELKLDLIQKITELEEIRIIEDLNRLIDFEMSEEVYQLSNEQEHRISEARAEYKAGKTLSNVQVEKEIDQWLQEK